ncbi:restriction endonuclease subunit S [Gallibacterium anatis]|uniref:restriction endonuclease subunit S n=1 Tax=Gallibacterium anatis TaxID=750 RepID=UPI000531167F|nr:restriction endonuclease subunit S [Gallibacterium anatis]KGQ45616.1 restriction endonuclease subunit S [Gallibacterium anatis]
MNYLEKLLQGAPVEWKTLGEILERAKGTKITAGQMKELHQENAPIKIFAGGKTFALVNYGDIPNKDIHTKPSIIVKSRGIIEFEYYDKPFSHKNEMWSYHSENENIDLKYVFYFLKSKEPYFQQIGSKMQMPQIATPDTDKFLIPIPPLSVQKEIARILDAFTAITSELTSELTLRQKQYQHYRDKLLTFGDEVEWKTLGEIAEYAKTKIQATELHENNYVGVDNLLQNKMGKTTSNYVPDSGRFTQFIDNDILIGNIRPYLKKIWYSDCIGGTNGDVLVIRRKDNRINPRYLYQVLSDDKFFVYNMKHAKGAKMPRGNKEAILQYLIPIPSLEEQERITAILDKFHTLTSSLSDGLPKEIELRQKQYEYYRDLLLGFGK